MNYLIFFILVIVSAVLFGRALGFENRLKIRKNFKRTAIVIITLWVIIITLIIVIIGAKSTFVYYCVDLFFFFFAISFVVTIFIRGGVTGKEGKKSEIEYYQTFYKTHFGWTVDFNRVLIPPKPEKIGWRLLIIAKGMTCNKVYDVWSKLFKCSKYTNDLDKEVTINIRTSSDHYAIWVRDGEEPDTEFLGKSTQEVDSDMKIGMTLLERMILELKHFTETGKHLDVKGVTFCSGSRDSDGNVPVVCWGPPHRSVAVFWYGVSNSSSDCGVRRAVFSL